MGEVTQVRHRRRDNALKGLPPVLAPKGSESRFQLCQPRQFHRRRLVFRVAGIVAQQKLGLVGHPIAVAILTRNLLQPPP